MSFPRSRGIAENRLGTIHYLSEGLRMFLKHIRSFWFVLVLTVAFSCASSASASGVNTISATSSTGLDITLYSQASNYTLYGGASPLWANLQPNGYVSFQVNTATAGNYNLQLYYATTASNAGANILVNGSLQATPNLPPTPNWGTFQLNPTTSIYLPAGVSTLQVAAQASFQPFNLAGMILAPGAGNGGSSSSSSPVTALNASAATTLNLAHYDAFNAYTFYPGGMATWGNLQPGGFTEYTVSSSGGNYNLSLYYATTVSGATTITVNGQSPKNITLNTTNSWNTYLTSPSVTLSLPSGNAVIRIAAASTYAPFNIQGITLTPAAASANVATTAAVFTSSLNPLANLNFFVNPYSEGAQNVNYSCAQQYPSQPNLIAQKIASKPQGVWFGDWNTNVQGDVSTVVASARAVNQVPIVVAYDIPIRDCAGYSGGGATSAAVYQSWIQRFASGIGQSKAAVILEPDALSQLYTPGCLNSTEQAERLSLLTYAVNTLKQTAPNAAVYIDAGNSSDNIAPSDMASRLASSGVANAAGFALNVSYYGWTSENTTYGNQISQYINNKHFVIDTSRNGQGPVNGGTWCNAIPAGLGSPSQGFASGLVDAYLWVQNPGTSDGYCNDGPAAGTFWGWDACVLAANASF